MNVITKIKLSTMNDVKRFVAAASECDFDVEASYEGQDFDAKSLLGMLSVDLNHTLNIISYGYNEEFEQILKEYEVK